MLDISAQFYLLTLHFEISMKRESIGVSGVLFLSIKLLLCDE